MRKILPLLMAFTMLPFLVSCHRDSRASLVDIPTGEGIIGGAFAQNGEFPFAVNIWANEPEENYVAHLCGGSLIAANWVLTAAHCVLEDASESQKRVISPTKLILYVGGVQHSGNDGRSINAKSIYVHPDFSWPNTDIALIELSESVTNIQPVNLNNIDLSNYTDPVTVLGWGLTDSDGRNESDTLKKLTAPLLPVEVCNQDGFPKARGYNLGSETLCIETYGHQQSSCPGDSGGPLVMIRNNQYVQVGVVSWGSACSGVRSKGSSAAGYAAVSHALPWIQKMLRP